MLTSGVSFDATTHLLVRNYARNQERVGVSVEQLSTGKRINRPSDDPSSFVAAEEIRRELRELEAEGRAATHGRINFLRQQAAWANVEARMQAEQLRADRALRESDGGDLPINANPSSLTDVPFDRSAFYTTGSRADEAFTQFREDKEVILTEALSQIEDTDFAVATAELAQGQVLTDAAIVALAYATQQLTDQIAAFVETIDVTVD